LKGALKKLLAAGFGLALLALATVYWMFWASPGPVKGPHTIIVEQGMSLNRVIDHLVRIGAVPGSRDTYRAMARVFGSSDPIQAGEFAVPAGTSGA
jgi:UPF0755 protein